MKLLLLLLGGAKFGKLLTIGGTMLISLGVYALIWGWRYAAGFIALASGALNVAVPAADMVGPLVIAISIEKQRVKVYDSNGLFAEGAEELTKPGVDEAEALRIGIRCERNSHRFFKRYGEKFEDSEGKQIFLEFAEEEREHLELLIREYRALITRTHAHRRKGGAAKKAAARGRAKRQPA